MTQPVPVAAEPQDRGYVDVTTHLVRRFLDVMDDELAELTAFVGGRPWVAQCSSENDQVQLLREAHAIRGFAGAYQLVNGPVNPALAARYEQGRWQPARNGRAADADIQTRRALYIDIDPIRPKGISATVEELEAAREVALALRGWLTERLGQRAIGHGTSGNGFYLLIAIEPDSQPKVSTPGISKFLKMLGAKFGTDRVVIDSTVSNPARLMPAPGTWKRKGIDHPERPHRETTFSCRGTVERIPLTEIVK